MKNKKTLIMVLLFIFSCLSMKITSEAKEISKEIELELPQDYVQCSFTASSEDTDIYTYQLSSPSGKTYFMALNSEGIYECSVKNVKQGTWILKVNKLVDDEAEESTEIGKVTVNVKSDTESKEVLDNKIQIAKEIANLKLYFKDDDIIVEWEDDTCGNINIKVYNTKNYQIIKDETVKEQSFSCNIPSDVEEITVEVVPATSMNIEGAGETYTLKVDNHPSADIVFENKEYTNNNNTVANVRLNSPYSLVTEVNGNVKEETELFQAGEYDIDIPLDDGNNDIKVYVVDEKGNMRSYPYQTILDIEPPLLMLENNEDGTQTYNSKVTLSGTVEDYTTLMFQNQEVEVDWDGHFNVEGTLRVGENKVTLTAYDQAGNTAEYIANVTMLVKKEIPWVTIITASVIVILIVVLIVFSIIKLVKRPKRERYIPSPSKDEKTVETSNYVRKSTKIQLILLGLISIMIIIFFTCVVKISWIPSASMEPKIMTGDLIVTNRLAYTVRTPQRGDIICFSIQEEKGKTIVKRIIGMPGDTVSFIDGYVFINGTICSEEYLPEDTETNDSETFVVPEDSYFVLGDNRMNSFDSRYWSNAYVNANDIQGKVIMNSDILNIVSQIF